MKKKIILILDSSILGKLLPIQMIRTASRPRSLKRNEKEFAEYVLYYYNKKSW